MMGIIIGSIIACACILGVSVLIKSANIYRNTGGRKGIEKNILKIQNRADYTRLDDMSPALIFTALALEDEVFFEHCGIRPDHMLTALKVNLKARRIVMGGSSLSQQLAKNLLKCFERTLSRKMAELFVVQILEKAYSKEEILEIYLNGIEYGSGNWSIAAACQYYTNASPAELRFDEAVSIFAIIPSPKNYAPKANLNKFLGARDLALQKLLEKGYIRDQDANWIRNSGPFEPILKAHEASIYQQICKNTLRWSSETRSALVLDVNSEFLKKVFNRELTAKGLCQHVKMCQRSVKTTYVWGGILDRLTPALLNILSEKYPEKFSESVLEKAQKSSSLDQETYGVDCSGLIKSYWFGGSDHPHYNAYYDLNSQMLFDQSVMKGSMETFCNHSGLCLYMPGHVGVYIGDGFVVEATSNPAFGDGVVTTKLEDRLWTNWFECPFLA